MFEAIMFGILFVSIVVAIIAAAVICIIGLGWLISGAWQDKPSHESFHATLTAAVLGFIVIEVIAAVLAVYVRWAWTMLPSLYM